MIRSAYGNDGPVKQAILDFVHTTTDQARKKLEAPEDYRNV